MNYSWNWSVLVAEPYLEWLLAEQACALTISIFRLASWRCIALGLWHR